ncbi:MAG: IS21-like element helper ATPase IstB [candidate division Zixibacteria bacterium]|nr:IS21-like element helper ATPase IstB [candidate division Zixibacteria bacterium]
MLTSPTLEKLKEMRLLGMAGALEDQLRTPEISSLGFEERLGLMVDREQTERDNRRLKTRLTKARLRQQASLEDIDYSGSRGLDKAQLLDLGSCRWITEHNNLLLTGPTGAGKTYIACALAQKACRQGLTALYLRLPRLFGDLTIAKGDGRYGKLLVRYSRVDLMVLDDWGVAPMTAENRRDLLEILDDRYEKKSTLITSQLPVEKWHRYLEDPTLADAILDRVVHNAYRVELKGESMRKRKGKS